VRDDKSGKTKSQIESETKVKISQAENMASAMGKMDSSITRIMQNITNPKADWKTILKKFVDETAKNDYSWNVPNRRYVPHGLYLPSLFSNELGKIVLAVDTSGSIQENQLNRFASELQSILKNFSNVELLIIYCDTDIRGIEKIDNTNPEKKLTPIGKGGTDFRPPFQYLEKNGIDPKCLIYFTDLYCNRFPKIEPNYPVLWASTTSMDSNPFQIPFGEIVEI